MTDWISPEWKSLLERHGLVDFDSVWHKSLDRVDEPNRGRGGWSEVCRYLLNDDSAPSNTLYVKRQENYTGRSWNRPFTSLPTFEREYNNLIWCQQHDIPVVKPVAFMKQKYRMRAILITAGLDDYISLSDLERDDDLSEDARNLLILKIADLLSAMHSHGFRHGCLYSKHIYINQSLIDSGEGDIRLIDLEKGQSSLFGQAGVFRDLDSFNRHAVGWSKDERSRFLERYLGGDARQFKSLYRRLDDAYHSWISPDA